MERGKGATLPGMRYGVDSCLIARSGNCPEFQKNICCGEKVRLAYERLSQDTYELEVQVAIIIKPHRNTIRESGPESARTEAKNHCWCFASKDSLHFKILTPSSK